MSKPYGYWNNIDNCIQEAKKYKTVNELKHKANGCYKKLKSLDLLEQCFETYNKRKPNGYWNDYDRCLNEAMTYRNSREWQLKSYGSYKVAKDKGWHNEISSLFNTVTLYHSYDEKIHCVYVYEIEKLNSCYVGRTNNIRRRHNQHLRDFTDNLHSYCIKNDINIPYYKILKENLNAKESQFYEDLFLKDYQNKGWDTLNKAVTGINKGSLGATCKWTYEKCKEEAEKYKSIVDFELNSQSAYNACKRNKWTYDFFPNHKLPNGYWDIYENCKKAFLSCSNARELKNKYGGCYNSIRKNQFNDLRYKR